MAYIAGGRLGAVQVGDICMDVEEVSAAWYGACIDAGVCTLALAGDQSACTLVRSEKGDDPVNCVDLPQAASYCAWLGKRLPQEAEWAWAARGGAKAQPFPWGAEPVDRGRACVGRSDEEGTCAVGSFPTGTSPQGVMDLVGNVAEWVVDGDHTATEPASGLLLGRGWSSRLPALDEDFALRSGEQAELSEAERGFRCAVAVRTKVLSVELDRWRPRGRLPRELPTFADVGAPLVPTRPLGNLTILSRNADTWWSVGGRYMQLDPLVAPALDVHDPLELGPIPEVLGGLTPSAQLGAMTLYRGGWARGRRLVALERETMMIRWELNLSVYGSSFLDTVGPQTLVVGIYGDTADTLLGFALDDGTEVWRIEGGEGAETLMNRVEDLWIEGDRGFARGDRGVISFDLVSGAILGAPVPIAAGCGVAHGDRRLVIEEEDALRIFDVDASGLSEVGTIARPEGAKGCLWGQTYDDGGVIDGVVSGGTLYTFGPPRDTVGTLYAIDLEGGAVRWKRPKLDVDTLTVGQDGVYVARAGEFLLALDATTGAQAIELSTAGSFSVELVNGGGAAGPLVVVETDSAGFWVLGRAAEPTPPEAYTIRGRLVPDEGVPRRRVAGVDVRIGGRWHRTDSRGRFRGKGRTLGAIGVTTHDDTELYEAAENSWGPFFRFDGENVFLNGSATYDVGDLSLYRWYSE